VVDAAPAAKEVLIKLRRFIFIEFNPLSLHPLPAERASELCCRPVNPADDRRCAAMLPDWPGM
jgi:hypothetical protein